MALTGTDRGTGNNGTTGLTLAVVPASNLTAGAMAVLVVSADNTGASGIYSITTCTDTKGNVWTRQQSPLYDPGAAAAGVQGAIFTTPQYGGALTTSDTITVTFSVTTVAKAWTLMEVVGSAGLPGVVAGGVNAGAATAAPTVTTVSITAGDMVIGGLFNEYGTAQIVTGDADSTNGTWSAQQTNEVGLTAAGMGVSSQRKVVTATATQTFNPTLLSSSDVILAYIVLTEQLTPTVAHVQNLGSVGNGTAAQTSLVLSPSSKTVTVGNTIVVAFGNYFAASSVSTITDNLGNTYALIRRTTGANGAQAELWYAPVTTGGSITTITANFGSTQYIYMTAAEFSGIGAPASATGTTGSGNTATWSASTTIEPFGVIIGAVTGSLANAETAGYASGTPLTDLALSAFHNGGGNESGSLTYAIARGVQVTGFIGTTNIAGVGAVWAGAGGVFPVASAEAHSGSAVLTGGGTVASTRVKGGQSASVLTGGGVVVADRSSARATTQTLTGAGVVTSSRVKGGSTTQVQTGAGVVVSAQTSARASTQALTASGRVVVSSTDDRQANVLLTGAGVVTSAITTAREASALLTGGGVVTSSASGFEAHAGTLIATGGGVVTTVQSTERASGEVLTGAGVVTLTSAANEPHVGTASLTGAGVVATEVSTARLLAALLSGGGVLTETQTTTRAADAVLTASGRVTISSGSNIQINVLFTGGGTVTTVALADRPAAFFLSGAGESSLSVTSARLVAVLLSGGGVVTASATGSEEPPFVPDIPHGGRNIKITRHVWEEDDEEVLIALLTM